MSLRARTLALDDRREIWLALKRLGGRERIAFLQWCCNRATGRKITGVRVSSHTGTVDEAYRDLLALEFQFGLDLNVAADELIRRVRRM